MRIINPDAFVEAKKRFNNRTQQNQINRIWSILENNQFSKSQELKAFLPSMEVYPGQPNTYRFDIGGRKGLRMIAVIRFRNGNIYIHMIGTHDEYDRFSL